MELHCSDLPRVCSCPALLVRPTLVVQGNNNAAAIGNAVHEALAVHVRGGQPDVLKISEKHGVDKAMVFPLFAGVKVSEDLAPILAVIGTEVQMGLELEVAPGVAVHLVGTSDVAARAHQEAKITTAILDWKTGVEKEFLAQLQGYAVLSRQRFPAEHFKCIVVMLRQVMAGEKGVVIKDLIPDEAEADLKKKLAWSIGHPDHYNPNYDNCGFCPRALECPGRTALVRQCILDLTEATKQIETATPAVLAALYPKAKLLSRMLDHFEATIRNVVMQAGELPTGDGKVLYFKESVRTPIDTAKAWPVLMAEFGDVAKFVGALNVGKGDLLDAVRATAPRGKKAGAVKEFMERLDAAGAVERKVSQVLSVRKEGEKDNGGTETAE